MSAIILELNFRATVSDNNAEYCFQVATAQSPFLWTKCNESLEMC